MDPKVISLCSRILIRLSKSMDRFLLFGVEDYSCIYPMKKEQLLCGSIKTFKRVFSIVGTIVYTLIFRGILIRHEQSDP